METRNKSELIEEVDKKWSEINDKIHQIKSSEDYLSKERSLNRKLNFFYKGYVDAECKLKELEDITKPHREALSELNRMRDIYSIHGEKQKMSDYHPSLQELIMNFDEKYSSLENKAQSQ